MSELSESSCDHDFSSSSHDAQDAFGSPLTFSGEISDTMALELLAAVFQGPVGPWNITGKAQGSGRAVPNLLKTCSHLTSQL